jgi:hypothetical protein
VVKRRPRVCYNTVRAHERNDPEFAAQLKEAEQEGAAISELFSAHSRPELPLMEIGHFGACTMQLQRESANACVYESMQRVQAERAYVLP